jgi:hypothetical protein
MYDAINVQVINKNGQFTFMQIVRFSFLPPNSHIVHQTSNIVHVPILQFQPAFEQFGNPIIFGHFLFHWHRRNR